MIKLIEHIFPVSFQLKLRRWKRAIYNPVVINRWARKGRPLPPPHEVKQALIGDFKLKYGFQVWIETGTYMGTMVEAQLFNFKKIFSIEIYRPFYERAVLRFKAFPHVTILNGDSSFLLPELINKIDEPIIFWLDGHYSGTGTGQGTNLCPVIDEIKAILSNKMLHVVLIDDARLFNGTDGYPQLNEFLQLVQSRRNDYAHEIKNDVICFFPK